MNLRLEEQVLCEVQGRLFENSVKAGYDSVEFIEKFMNSETARHLDMDYDRLQWMGEQYLLSELDDEVHLKKGKTLNPEMMFWTGYLYRFWHYYTKESSREIVQIADSDTMRGCWYGYHTLDPKMAVDRLKNIEL